MTHTINLKAHNRPEVMERVLRVVRHRGFALQQMSMQQCDINQEVNITLNVTGERCINNLELQLSKLYDVSHIELEAATAIKSAVAMNA
ncbi:acetolactate synthase 2 small subunit [Catenovulum maritimum]|nr:acetolactate synthase 2 small subunit [Catenovulum maritimum]